MGLLAKGVIWLLRRCVGAEAEETIRGREGRIAKAMLILPLLLLAIFAGVASYVLGKPVDPERAGDPAEVVSGWILGASIPAVLLWTMVYFMSFRVLIGENIISVSSLVTRRKEIRLDEPFTFSHDEEQDEFRIVQGNQRLRLGWIVNGYAGILNLVWIKSRRWQ